ncbi:DUF2254 domain-containing protein [Streptomyces sp. NBC_00090]|uniref:DUF2254 family protein n=1 Tax=Streptomyces sp. NBC_00090 TaxID=2903619 RepID=UPI00324F8810
MMRGSALRRSRGFRAGSTQLLFALVGVALGLALPGIDRGPQVSARLVIDMLVALGFGVLGAIAVIFSLLILVVQWAHTTFSPRLTLFREAPIVWRSFAFAVGLALFCGTAALAIGSGDQVSLTVPVLTGLLLLTLLGLLRRLQVTAFTSVQLAPVLQSVSDRGRRILESLYSRSGGQVTSDPLPPLSSTVTWPKPFAVLQEVDAEQLLTTARAANAVIVLHAVPGATLPHGAAVADVHGAQLPAAAVLDGLITGSERTFEQDPLLAFRLLADIALRALSKAINDPATAVQALDHLEDLLTGPVATHSGRPLRLTDPDGVVRIVVELPDWEDFLRTGVDDVIAAAGNAPMVLTRLRTLVKHLMSQSPPHRRELLTRRLAWVEEGLASGFPTLWREAAGDAGGPAEHRDGR